MEQQGEIILYQPDESVRMEVRIEDETVWLTQAQIVELFQSSKANISEHLKNIYKSEELIQSSTVRNEQFARQQTEPKIQFRCRCDYISRIPCKYETRNPIPPMG